MATNAFCGKHGAVLVGTHEVAEIGNWDLAMSNAPSEVPKFGSSKEKIVCGGAEWSGTFSGSWYMGDSAGQAALEDACMDGTTVSLVLSADHSASQTDYSGTAYITNVSVSTPYDGFVSVTFNFEGTGTLTRSHASATP